ncbi:MAG: LexA repressor [Candidatus Scalindua rubra]|uniref:LexA repressor n=1 Tax=Candidatus Scalindua rubra TaxID=1872076 RepID=A0A1E3X2E0_9BACT|nr:MAG: LexA repressor [Candidatus Scalindua rubra]
MPAEKDLIPIISIADAGAGILAIADVTDEWLSRPHGVRGVAYAVRVASHADSMSPRYDPGMLVVASPNVECVSGDFAVVGLSNDNKTIKQVFFREDKVILHSLNPDYDDVEIEKEELEFCDRIIWSREPKW